jgi:short-subunit dehydrogenase
MKKILIIGATSAIASACARLWAAQGARLFLVGRDMDKLNLLAADLSVRGAAATCTWPMEATDLATHTPMLKASLEFLGSLDIALIAHGTLPDQAACEGDAAQTLQEFNINCTSVIALLTILANQFEKQRSGALAVITSVAGDRGRPSNYVYGSAKAAVSSFCEGMRARLFKAGVSLTDIRPGFVATPMTQGLPLPALLVAQPDSVARRIVAGITGGVDVLYAPFFWVHIMRIIRNIPRFVFKRMKL